MIDTFLKHIGNGELDAVRTMLAANPTLVNAVGAHPFWGGRPQPLHVAIEGGRRPMIELLLEHGADVSGTNDQYDHWSPLMLAIDRNRPDVIEELRKRGAKIGLTEALMLADDARVDELLRDGLPSYAPNGGSILAFARTPHAIDRLLDLGADTQTKDRWGSSPIDAMSRLGRRGQPLVRHLISRGVPASPREYARLGDLATLSRVIADDPSIAKQDAVMMGAVDFSHHELVEWLLAHGANVNARADAQARQSALHSAAWNGDLRMVELLVNHGADVHARDAEYNASPLGWAETSIVVTNNAKCEAVAAYLRSRS
ncbi:MAG: ankyrin repeat domain-containing protein [Thermoanaerobaculia bacterium]